MVDRFAAKTAKRRDWDKWKLQLERLFLFEPKYAKDEDKKFNTLLTLGGADLEELYNVTPKLEVENEIERFPRAPWLKKPYSWAIERLNKHFEAGCNIQLEMSMFSEMKQNENESFEQYLVRLKTQSEYCDFGKQEENQLIHQLNKSARLPRVRTKALEPEISLIKLSAYAAQQEVIEKSKSISKPCSDEIGKISVDAIYGKEKFNMKIVSRLLINN